MLNLDAWGTDTNYCELILWEFCYKWYILLAGNYIPDAPYYVGEILETILP